MPDIGIITEAPAWFILLCIAGGIAYAMVLYYRERKSELSTVLRSWLAILRAIAVSLIAFLLLSPYIRSTDTEREQPAVIIALDNSQSLAMGPDSVFYRQQVPVILDELAGELDENYDVERYLFAEDVNHLSGDATFSENAGFSGKQTDMSVLFSHIEDIYSNRNLGAIVIAGDGIYNRGINPVYAQRRMDVPVYTLAMGDTSVRKDLLVANVRYNRLAFFKNEFPMQVIVNAFMSDGEEMEVSVYQGGRKLASETISVDGNSSSFTVNFLLSANETGLQRYKVAVSPIPGEVNTANNTRDIFIEVLDSRNRVLILAAAPHPDVAAIKEAIRENVNYEVEDALASEFTGPLEPYNLVMLHQVPYQGFPGADLKKELIEKKIPYLAIAGGQTDYTAWNAWQNGLELQVTPNSYEEALPLLNREFSLFSLDGQYAETLNNMPPLTSPFGNYLTGNGVRVLMYQKIGAVETSRPLIGFASDGAYRWGFIMGDGIWKWRLTNFARRQNHDAFNELIQKIVQYLSIREERGQFRVVNDSRFVENEPVRFEAEVYNDSYELITEPEVDIVIKDEEGKEYPFTMSKMVTGYVLNAGRFAPGKYSFVAEVNTGGRSLRSSGGFFVEPIDVESLVTVADHDLLRTLAQRSGGSMLPVTGSGELIGMLGDREDLKPVIYEQKRFRELISLTILLGVIILLLSVEWFLRKRAGSY